MQFRHPELLYALFLLLIPILVHLFQLRKFKTEAFTNVAFLQKLNIQTRKSNSIKKWLVLLSRMAAIAAIVLAFAQPFITQSDSATREKETIIYLDNSFSMQAKGPSGQLLRTATQDIITNIPEDQIFTLITNTDTYRNTSIKNMRNELLQLPYAASQLSETAVTLRAQKEFSRDQSKDKRLIMISDFQDNGETYQLQTDGVEKHYVQLQPVIKNNVSIDSVFISQRKSGSIALTVALSAGEKKDINTAVSLYNGDQLLAKGTASFDSELTTTVIFDIDTKEEIAGRIVIEDPLLAFDNTMFFNINKSQPIKVLAINGANSDYLSRIFTAPEFEYKSTNIKNLDYSSIPEFNYIVVNQVSEIGVSLSGALNAFAKAGGITTIILDPNADAASYNNALRDLGNFEISKSETTKRLVTTINYDHPVYKDVFDARIKNFQYPSVSKSFALQGGDALLRFEDGSPFLSYASNFFVISGGIDVANSNLQSSPLIVPTFYNMSRQSLQLPRLYMPIGKNTTYDIPVALQEDDILSLEDMLDPSNTLIPLQQSKGNKVQITTSDSPSKASIYNIKLSDNTVQQVSYNYSRSESTLRYAALNTGATNHYNTSVEDLFDEFKTADSVQSLWKWFVIFALLFLVLEILILKFYK
ncbi:BatA domain-containing protein [uncultured Dokdonia sp.]|uniref:BatA domain-containing protein n=1 Tax=uncultured Dokdonia sp. TaxID=575653 RepID=UPI0026090C3F|nr:BatA domain-containing protein [uncultured Dokdonia sp.]